MSATLILFGLQFEWDIFCESSHREVKPYPANVTAAWTDLIIATPTRYACGAPLDKERVVLAAGASTAQSD